MGVMCGTAAGQLQVCGATVAVMVVDGTAAERALPFLVVWLVAAGPVSDLDVADRKEDGTAVRAGEETTTGALALARRGALRPRSAD